MSLPEWNYLHGKPEWCGRFKVHPEDFVVIEDAPEEWRFGQWQQARGLEP